MASLDWYKKLNDASGIKQRTESILLTGQVTCFARSFSRVVIHAPFTGYDISTGHMGKGQFRSFPSGLNIEMLLDESKLTLP